jgi:hypothetical protein
LDDSANVAAMQEFLKSRGYPIVVDGRRGPETEAVVQAFHDGLDPDEFKAKIEVERDRDSPEQLRADLEFEREMERLELKAASGPSWVVEIDGGYGWQQYLNPYADKSMAKRHARELPRHGRRIRVRKVS